MELDPISPRPEDRDPSTEAQAPSADPQPATREELLARAQEAVTALRREQPRDSRGRLLPGAALNLQHGMRAEQLLDRPDIAAWHQEQVAAIIADLGGESELSTLGRANVTEAARLQVILAALGEELLTAGVLTGKGKTRAATLTYLHVLDRFTKLSAALGLGRKQKRVDPLDAVRMAVAEANK